MPQVDEITVSRHAAQQIMHHALSMMPHSCVGLLAGHGCSIDAAIPLTVNPQDTTDGPRTEDIADATEKARQHGMGILGWFHSRIDSHEPDDDTMQRLEQASAPVPELGKSTSPFHLLVALGTKGRMDLHAYVRNHGDRMAPVPLRLLDDSPLYLGSVKR